jgi:hypothetical protein
MKNDVRRLTPVVMIFLLTLPLVAQTRVADYTITSMQAKLFYDNTGTFSRDVSEASMDPFVVPSILWNTPMEGSSREGASTSVLVTVEVSGEYEASAHRRIEFTARYRPIDTRKEIVVRRFAPVFIRESGKYVAGFWLNETGCNPVKLTARIVGQRKASLIRRVIRFGCGE